MTSPFLSKAEATSFLSVSTSRHNKFLSTSLGMRSDVNSGWEYFYETVADNTANVGESYFKNYKTVRWRPTTNFFLCRARCRTWRQQCFAVVSLQVRRKRFSRNSRSGRSSDSTTSRRRSWASAHTRSSDWREQLACADVGSEIVPPPGALMAFVAICSNVGMHPTRNDAAWSERLKNLLQTLLQCVVIWKNLTEKKTREGELLDR